MEVSQLSYQFIALELASLEKQIGQLIAQKKSLLDELARREDILREKYRRGDIPMERGVDE